ncbi:DUF6807 domain-containing protein [Sphingobacterium suaedae]|uniref:PmoA family protein n=1 Tax=Sphingobacterium suaedae TaxID=1686402 RepID=A0ABW5KCU7_9SPHI
MRANRSHLYHYLFMACLGWMMFFRTAVPCHGQVVDSLTVHVRLDSVLTIMKGTQSLLTYQFNTVFPPDGQDSSYKRSGFIHPLNTLSGRSLTRIQPKDHYHHYGIWNAWTHTLFEQDTIDFWNLKKKLGTVRFVKLKHHQAHSRHASYSVLHDHVVYQKDGTEKVAIHELQTVDVYLPSEDSNYYWVDLRIDMRCASDSPIQLLMYRYGGLGWRATESWDASNSELLTSEGDARSEADGSRVRWCAIQGVLSRNTYGGMAIFSNPKNYNHPEPIRTWDAQANNGQENVFLNFTPTRNRHWTLEPGKSYTLRYRFLIFDGKMSSEALHQHWKTYAEAKK